MDSFDGLNRERPFIIRGHTFKMNIQGIRSNSYLLCGVDSSSETVHVAHCKLSLNQGPIRYLAQY